MPAHQPRRHKGGDPALLRQLRGEPAVAAVDKPATPAEWGFAALITATMLLISAYVTLI